MNAKQLWISVAAVVLSAVVTAGFTGAIQIPWDGDSQPASAVGGPSKIHFNGVLTDPVSGNPLNGFFSMTFRFFDVETEGTALWSETQASVRVNKGVFNVFLGASTPFPPGLFELAPLFLEIQVGSDLPMTPRQEMARVPAAFFADRADHANNSDNSTHANNSDRSTNADRSDRSTNSDRSDRSTNSDRSDRAGVANDLDCTGCVSAGELGTVGPGPVVPGQVLFFDGASLVWKTMYLPNHTILVSPIGTPVQNGVALLNALAGITDASATNPYLIKIEPGVYQVQSPGIGLKMKEFVDIEGSGEGVTHIVGGTGVPEVVRGADNAELRFLSVENTGGSTGTAVAIKNDGTSTRLTHVTARASNASTVWAMYNTGGPPGKASPVMTDVTAVASLGGQVIAIYNNNESSPIMNNVTAQASDGTDVIAIANNGSKPEMTDVTAVASRGTEVKAIYNNNGSSPIMNDVTAQASDGTDVIAIEDLGSPLSSLEMTDVTAEASGGSSLTIGVETSGAGTLMMNRVTATATSSSGNASAVRVSAPGPTSGTVTIDGLRALASGTGPGATARGVFVESGDVEIHGSSIKATSSVGGFTVAIEHMVGGKISVDSSELFGDTYTVTGGGGGTVRIGGSLMSGGPVGGGPATVRCAGVHDENYTFFAGPACP